MASSFWLPTKPTFVIFYVVRNNAKLHSESKYDDSFDRIDNFDLLFLVKVSSCSDYIIRIIYLLLCGLQREDVDGATVAATSQPFWLYIKSQRVDSRVLGPTSQLLDALALFYVEYADQSALLGSCGHLVAIRAQHERAEGWLMSLDFLALRAGLWKYLDESYLFARVDQDELFSKTAHGAQSLGVGAGLNWLEHPKISEVKYKYFRFQNNNASIDFNFDCLHFRFAACFHNDLQYGYYNVHYYNRPKS